MGNITNIGQLVKGMKVTAEIEGRFIPGARVKLGTGADGKPRVWFCQNAVAGSDNRNPYWFRYAFSVGVNANGTLRLETNRVTLLREWRASDDAPAAPVVTEIVADGMRYAADGTASSAGLADSGMEFKTVAKFDYAIAEREKAIAKYRARKAAYNGFARQYGWPTVG